MKRRHALKSVYGVSNLHLPMQSLKWEDVKHVHIKLPVKPYDNAQPKLLLGLDHAHLGLASKTKYLSRQGPFAAHTDLGWIVFGSLRTTEPKPATNACLFFNASEATMEKQISDYFETEGFGVKPLPPIESKDDTRARRLLEETTTRGGNRFQTGLLWKSDNINLPNSCKMALKRLIGIENKMSCDESLAKTYCDTIQSYIDKGYCRQLSPSEVDACTPSQPWYLPHFAAFNPNKLNKFRLVFDAAAMVVGTFLNSVLLKGPQTFKQPPPVLVQFREGSIAVCGDIKEMFHHVLVRPEDRHAQRFLWRNGDKTREPDVYEMQVMTFGATCSPCSADYVKILNARQHTANSQRAIESIVDHHYIDDFVDSFALVPEAIQITEEVRRIHASAGFELCQFTSNSQEVLHALDSNAARQS